MSVTSVLATVGNDVGGFLKKVAADWKLAKQAWALIGSPQTRALLIKIGKDVVQTVRDAEAAVAAEGMNFTLDAATVADIKELIADGIAGDGVIASDLKVLGITL